ncbi:chorismate mutase [Streptomyces sp. SP17BM10]|uniref:chorismate mutase n=1 Tax=Streptomyces sp. SP17BM10 TaxID=3002530 RepID=UPI002E761AB6|nr:chorismate mutase [Streptomyces sp. SP17BM10]MEE1783416.1 chorismate mutase [Streptomyces sp. SP17BM10]
MPDDIATLDRQIIRLLGRRTAAARQQIHARVASGGSRTSLAEENLVIDRYREELGRPGVNLALLVLGLPERLPAR